MADLRSAGQLEWLRSWLARPGCLVWLLALAVMAGAGIVVLLFAQGQTNGPEQPGIRADAPSPSATPGQTPDPTSSAPPRAPGWTVRLPDSAGGLTLIRSGGAELAHRESAMQQAGLPVVSLVGGQYEEQADSATIEFFGGELTEPAPAGSPQDTLETTFEANFPNLTPAGPAREHDAGPLAGEVWCVTYDEYESSACGWVDDWTIGYVFVARTAEADAAEHLLTLRADAETEAAG